MQSNLPPGVTERVIPGNRAEDLEWDHFYDWLEDVLQNRSPREARLAVEVGLAALERVDDFVSEACNAAVEDFKMSQLGQDEEG